MSEPLQQIKKIIDTASTKIRELSFSKGSYAEIKEKYKTLIDECIRNISTIILKESNAAGYNPVITFNSLILGQKIIITDNHFLEIHKGTHAEGLYGEWRTNIDEQTTLHWGKCLPHGKNRYILIEQTSGKIDKVVNKLDRIEKNDCYKCMFPSFQKINNYEIESVKEIIKKSTGYISKFRNGIYELSGYEDIVNEPDDDKVIESLFNPSIVRGWKSLFTTTRQSFSMDFISNIQFLNSLYLCSKDEPIDIKEKYEVLKKIDGLYYDSARALYQIEQTFLTEYLGINNLHQGTWNVLEDMIEKGAFDRYKVLCSYSTKTEKTKKEKEEKDAYQSQLEELLKELYRYFDDCLQKHGIWLIFNYSSMFLDKRLNVLRPPGKDEIISNPDENDELSWYGLFGSIKRNIVFSVVKSDTEITKDTILHSNKIRQTIYDPEHVLYIPEDEGMVKDKYDETFCNKFKTALKDFIPEVVMKFLTDSSTGIINTKLFSENKMHGWNKECLIFSNKYKVDFADSLEFVPNFLFFKKEGSFSEEDNILCHIINTLCVKIATDLMLFESDILLDRLEDLVDSKPKRIFDSRLDNEKIKKTDVKEKFIPQVKEVFHPFIENDLRVNHPIIKHDLVIAFYLYWTLFYADDPIKGDYLDVPAWVEGRNKALYAKWRKAYERGLKSLGKSFDFKEIIFETKGEKPQVEFVILNDREFKAKYEYPFNEDTSEEREFLTIFVGDFNNNALSDETKNNYKDYLKKNLKKLLADMGLEEKAKEPFISKIGDGSNPAKYFSLFCHKYLTKLGCKYVYYIPSVNYDGGSSGGFSFFCKSKWPRSITKAAQTWATRFGTTFSEIEAKKIVTREIMKYSTKAAVAAIISRNHSHHIGSHVVPRTDIKKIEERIKKLSCGNYSYDCQTACTEVVPKLEALSDIVNILKGRLDGYVQKKADFVAEIATEPLTTTKDVKLFDEVILGFINNVLLMDNLGANEGVRYKNCCNNRLKLYFKVNSMDLSAKYKATGCTKNEYSDQQYPYATNCQCCCNKELQRDSIAPAGKDVNIAVPGSLGEFAFFAFLENFIRNGIKHNKKDLDEKPNEDFKVHIELTELDTDDRNEFYKVEVYDNFSDPEKEISVEDIDGNGVKTENKIKLPEYLQSCIQKPIVNDDGSLRKEAWGIAEMKIMATLLRGSSDFSEMAENLKVKSSEKDGNKRLVYEFYVMKPKNVAIIGTKSNDEEAQKKQGIWWFDSLDEYEKHISNGKSPASFKFLIIDKNLNDDEKNKLKEIKKCLPFRVLINDNYKNGLEKTIYFNSIDQDTINKLRNDNNGDGVLKTVWETWMNQFIFRKCNDKKPHLFLFFQQDEAEEPTSSWCNVNNISGIDISVLTESETILGATINGPNNKSLLVYDRHFSGYATLANQGLVGNIDFHEAFDKNSSDFIHLFTPYNNSPEKVYELVEAGLLKILVMDERIAEVAHNELKIEDTAWLAYGGQGRIFAAKKAGIYICTHVCVDDAEAQPLHLSVKDKLPSVHVKFQFNGESNSGKFNTVNTTVSYQNGGNVCDNIKDIDILIIHQGVLENFLKDRLTDKKHYDAFIAAVQKQIPYVVIDSGRGIPAKLPDAAKFLPFSLLEDFLMKNRIAKYSLTKNVMSLIRRKQYE